MDGMSFSKGWSVEVTERLSSYICFYYTQIESDKILDSIDEVGLSCESLDLLLMVVNEDLTIVMSSTVIMTYAQVMQHQRLR